MAVRLLFDANRAPRLVRDLGAAYPGSVHVRELDLQASGDEAIWARAAADGLLIVTKDDDSRQRSFLYRHRPRSSGFVSGTAAPLRSLRRCVGECASSRHSWTIPLPPSW